MRKFLLQVIQDIVDRVRDRDEKMLVLRWRNVSHDSGVFGKFVVSDMQRRGKSTEGLAWQWHDRGALFYKAMIITSVLITM